jgi:opacity protein-like surface antigen
MKRLLLAAALAIAAIAPAKAETTVEKWYAAFYPGTAVRGLIRVSTPETEKAGALKLSPDERKMAEDRVRRAELADCPGFGASRHRGA